MRRFFGFLALVFVISVLTLRINSCNHIGKWFSEKPKPQANPDSTVIKPKRIEVVTPVTPTPSGTILVQDDFSDNRNKWAVLDERERRQNVRNGKYRMENLSKDSIHWAYIDIPLTDEDNFMIEAVFTKIAGQTQNTFGLVWGVDAKKNLYTFGITDDGDYRISRRTTNWENLVPLKASSHIKKNDATNVLRMEKKGFKMMFYINNHLVHTLTHQAFFGKGIGFCTNADIIIDVDDFVVKKL